MEQVSQAKQRLPRQRHFHAAPTYHTAPTALRRQSPTTAVKHHQHCLPGIHSDTRCVAGRYCCYCCGWTTHRPSRRCAVLTSSGEDDHRHRLLQLRAGHCPHQHCPFDLQPRRLRLADGSGGSRVSGSRGKQSIRRSRITTIPRKHTHQAWHGQGKNLTQ